MRKIAVIGTGYVGLVSGTCFADIGNRVICCDVDEQKIAKLLRGEIPIYEPGLSELVARNTEQGRLFFTTEIGEAIEASDIIYIAVGTPMSETGEADMRYVMSAAKKIGEHLNNYKIIVNKSTVPVGTGELVREVIQANKKTPWIQFDVVSNPEFLREGSAIADCMSMDRAVIGSDNPKAAEVIADLHAPFNTRIFTTDLESAEMIKYAANTFLATKISFINAIANICERVGANVGDVAEGMGLDSRIGSKFLQAGIGYGGSCFPKDTYALAHISDKAGYDFELLKSVIRTNTRQRLVIMDKLRDAVGGLAGKHVAVLGLSFKPETDDMRYAPSLTIIPELIKQHASVYAYDPIAEESAKRELPEGIHYCSNIEQAVTNADVCIILTEWKDVLTMDLARIGQLMKNPILIDGRNCFDLTTMASSSFEYHSIGRPPVNRAGRDRHSVNF
ncbi:UDP-glucose 6-dehydrogenase TuaD [Paenibacillus baekrokdamisoli]|uniref:UDP-glucose 6-dehydrogenase n=1 Tax=Paenibacillus baekrokdamisoli TaxID=1712516 RepID=A0A3G9J4C4_9BACL|nr:UDP-glucose/GDP-mannose dehydrogenase family protein [Paenibacillus baekrokdamisoli]MBB3067238.1 UDPglucose 6-dehydrogenase [Paenibacillus baekrokdamisoli]BBH19573.1 UDP-glucose 6-dehydrogenase TuaD [Paenibacillus baekrokdamisoli]